MQVRQLRVKLRKAYDAVVVCQHPIYDVLDSRMSRVSRDEMEHLDILNHDVRLVLLKLTNYHFHYYSILLHLIQSLVLLDCV